jgi:hypothetical protein
MDKLFVVDQTQPRAAIAKEMRFFSLSFFLVHVFVGAQTTWT